MTSIHGGGNTRTWCRRALAVVLAAAAALLTPAAARAVGSVALAPVEPLIKEGKFRALAVTGAERWFSLPDVPTMIESGFPGFVSDTFNALFAPAGTPPEIVALLARESQAALKTPEARAQALRAGYQIVAGTPAELAARLRSEIPAVKELVARLGIKPQ